MVAATTKSSLENERLIEAGKKYAKKVIQDIFIETSIQDQSNNFPRFSNDEIILGKVLGKGGFGTVYEIHGFDTSMIKKHNRTRLSHSSMNGVRTTQYQKKRSFRRSSSSNYKDYIDDAEVEAGQMEYREFIAKHCIRGNGDARYALKVLSPNVVKDPGLFIRGMIDMATETRILSDIEQPNIIKMRALPQSISPYNEEYFIVMDRLYDTMTGRMIKWEKRQKKVNGMGGKIFDRNGEKKKELVEEIIVCGYDLSDALGYLHHRNILYRDLKPDNIGFDIRDDVKIFDFGLATELKESKRTDDGLYNLTGMTGSPVYMAPEVANDEHYNEKCDVYSFGMLLWEMYSLKKAFPLYTMHSFRGRVWKGECKRPVIDQSWPASIRSLLKRCWSQDLHERASFDHVTKVLRDECVHIRNGNEYGLEHLKRRSTYVFRGSKEDISSPMKTIDDRSGGLGEIAEEVYVPQ